MMSGELKWGVRYCNSSLELNLEFALKKKYVKLLCSMVPCFLVLHFSPKPCLLLENAIFSQIFGPVPQGHRKDCFVALPVCPASSQPSDRSSSSTRQCHWRGGDRGCYEVFRFLLANMPCPNSKCLYHLDFLQISKTDFRVSQICCLCNEV